MENLKSRLESILISMNGFVFDKESIINIQSFKARRCAVDIYIFNIRNSKVSINNVETQSNKFSTFLAASNSTVFIQNFQALNNEATKYVKLIKSSSSFIQLQKVSAYQNELSGNEKMIEWRNVIQRCQSIRTKIQFSQF